MYNLASEKWAGLAKFAEECNEALVVINKIIGNEGEREYWNGVDLLKELEDEMADVYATLTFFCQKNEHVLDVDRMQDRVDLKLSRYYEWIATGQGLGFKRGDN
jgi:NTP pyrophosphatase (non-canonical NTP hydrolase)